VICREHLLTVLCVCMIGCGDAGDSTVGLYSLLAAVPDRHHLRRISAQQTRAGQFTASL